MLEKIAERAIAQAEHAEKEKSKSDPNRRTSRCDGRYKSEEESCCANKNVNGKLHLPNGA